MLTLGKSARSMRVRGARLMGGLQFVPPCGALTLRVDLDRSTYPKRFMLRQLRRIEAEVRRIIEEDDAFAGGNEPADGLIRRSSANLCSPRRRIHPIRPSGGQRHQSVDVRVCERGIQRGFDQAGDSAGFAGSFWPSPSTSGFCNSCRRD